METTNVFFGHVFDPLSLSGKGLAMLLAVLLDGLLGLEAEPVRIWENLRC